MKKGLITILTLATIIGKSLIAPASVIPYTTLDEISRQTKKVAKEISYSKDIEGTWSAPEVTRAVGFGDCEDKAILLRDDLMRKKIKTDFEYGDMTSKPSKHAWLEYSDASGKRYVIESTNGRIYDKEKIMRKRFYREIDEKIWKPYFKERIDNLNEVAGRKIL